MIDSADVNGKVLYEDEHHAYIWLGADSQKKAGVVQTNQYLIVDKGRGILLDPGGVHLFSRVVSVVSRFIDLDKIDTIFFSHQDPDVCSGIALWLGVTKAKVYISGLWIRFMPHFGIVDNSRIVGIEQAGQSLSLASGAQLRFIPSHFLHSTGNYCLYDTRARILFSGDIGAAVFEEGGQYLFVENFDEHLKIMEGFHKRYLTGNIACKKWVKLVSALDIDMMTPQHGAIFPREHAKRFLQWLEQLRCGLDLIDSIYG